MYKITKIIRILFIPLLIALLVSLTVAVGAEAITVVLDPGHGGMDGGTDLGAKTEKEYDLELALAIRDVLVADGRFNVILTRTDDVALNFPERAEVARVNNADVLISIHCNSNPDTSVNGLMAYTTVVDRFSARDLSDAILDSISSSLGMKRGYTDVRYDTGDENGVYYWDDEYQWDIPGASYLGKHSDYYSINTFASKFGIPSIIVEHGYVTNEGDDAILSDSSKLYQMAYAEASAIIQYYYGHEHNWTAAEVDYPSSCMFTGTSSSRCSICGAKTGTVSLDPAPDRHLWVLSDSKEATCTEDGYKDYVCQISYNLNDRGYDCDVHTYREVVPATGHQYVVTEDTPASHGVDGRHVEICSVCGDEVVTITPGEPHTYEVTEDTEPTCTEDGVLVQVCTVCGDVISETRPATGHDFVEEERIDPDYENDGQVMYRCTVCGETVTEIIHGCDHEFEVTEISPTCTISGTMIETCTKCGYVRKSAIVPTGHDYELISEREPTCTEDGLDTYKCSVCGDIREDVIPAAGHDFEAIEDKHGRSVMKCTVCGAEESSDTTSRGLSEIKDNPLILAGAIIIAAAVVAYPIFLYHSIRKRGASSRNRGNRGSS